jgi:nitroimidazol reductase NimA-like FMN-containing flavoprotein (pyridoxamine 5'-phosphate oxidase superfamily)
VTSPVLGDDGLSSTERTRIRRIPENAQTDREQLHAVLDAGLVAHIGMVGADGQPFVLPVAYARDGERILIHGSTGSRLFRSLAEGAPACLTVTLFDGIVVARSTFESSMNYRSAMVLGAFSKLSDADAEAGLALITEHLIPGRNAEVRANAKKELAATMVLAVPLTEASVKIRTGGPNDDPDDLGTPVWAGMVPLRPVTSGAVAADEAASALPVPQSVLNLIARLS